MVLLRKDTAGSCNLGYTWRTDGAVVEVAAEHAASLLAIPFNDFSVVAAAEPAGRTIEEPAPAPGISEAPAERKAAAKRAAKKTAAAPEAAPVVEE